MEKRTFKILSVVVPSYDEEKYLNAVIRKVVTQPLPGNLQRELILINDASSDNTWHL